MGFDEINLTNANIFHIFSSLTISNWKIKLKPIKQMLTF